MPQPSIHRKYWTRTPDEELTTIEELYGIKFTDDEWYVLSAGTSDALLDPIERQHKYLLKMFLHPLKCPACQALVCNRSASPGGFDIHSSRPDDSYECPFCKAKLTWGLAIFGGDQMFTLNPGQTVEVGKGVVAPA